MHAATVDTSSLLYLHRIGLLELLDRLYSPILVPQAVLSELDAARDELSVPDPRAIPWCQIRPVELPAHIAALGLGAGESAVLALAQALDGMAVIDDQAARDAAELLRIEYTGLLGVLCLAKERALIEQVEPHLNALVEQGFWLSGKTRSAALKLAGE
jgi:predicted nucleic acid-binding protein